MATTVNFGATYTGGKAGDLIKLGMQDSSLISQDLIRVYESVLGTFYIPTMSVDPVFRVVTNSDNCDFNPDGTINLDEASVEVKKYTSEMEICLNQILPSWQREKAGLYSAFYDNLDVETEEAFLDLLLSGVAKWLDNNILYGNGTGSELDGIIPQLRDEDENVIDGIAITTENVVVEMQKVFAAIPGSVRKSKDLVIAVANNVWDAYFWNLSGQGCYTTTEEGKEELKIAGYRVVAVDAMEDNTILAYKVDNTAFATGLKSDLNQVKYVSLADNFLEEKVRAKVTFLAGVGIVDAASFVLYEVPVVS